MPAAGPSEKGIAGRLLTREEMLLDVVHIVRRRQWGERAETPAEARALMRIEVGYLPESIPVGTGYVPAHETELWATLERVAQRALEWLNDRAPAGYRFQIEGGLRLEPVADLTGPAIAPEAVLLAAAERGLDVPREIAQLAVSHVVGAPQGTEWRAIHSAAFVAAGPFTSKREAVDAVRAGRTRLRDYLRESGAGELADTFSRWTEIPVDQ